LAGLPLWQAAGATGAHLLWRVTKNRRLPVLKRLSDGSCLNQIEPAAATQKTMTGSVLPIAVRVIESQLPGAPAPEPLHRLITTLLDDQEVSAQTLARLYRERWTIETTLQAWRTVTWREGTNFAHRQVPAVPKDYLPRGRPARAATRRGLERVRCGFT
jgi:hypothetical protein